MPTTRPMRAHVTRAAAPLLPAPARATRPTARRGAAAARVSGPGSSGALGPAAPSPAVPSVSWSVSCSVDTASPWTGSVRAQVEITSAVGLPRELFACVAPTVTTRPPLFQKLCLFSDLGRWPCATPFPGASPPWFRSSIATLQFRSRAEAQSCLALLRAQIAALVATARALADAAPVTTVYAIAPPANL